jgi:two-component system sensor histidine kinase DesK
MTAEPDSSFQRSIRLSPHGKTQGWAHYIWLAYLVFFYIDPIMDHGDWKKWSITIGATVVFLALYFSLFLRERKKPLWHIAGMVLLGLAVAPFNAGAATFFIFAAAFIPFCVPTERAAIALMAGIVALAAIEKQIFHLSGWFLFYAGGMSLMVGGSNI